MTIYDYVTTIRHQRIKAEIADETLDEAFDLLVNFDDRYQIRIPVQRGGSIPVVLADKTQGEKLKAIHDALISARLREHPEQIT